MSPARRVTGPFGFGLVVVLAAAALTLVVTRWPLRRSDARAVNLGALGVALLEAERLDAAEPLLRGAATARRDRAGAPDADKGGPAGRPPRTFSPYRNGPGPRRRR